MSGLSVGILVDSALKQQYLGNMVVQAGYEIGYSCVLDSDSRLPDLAPAVDAWVIDLVEPQDLVADDKQLLILALLDEFLGQTRIPVILNDAVEFHQGSNEHQDWVRRMLRRLERLRGDINLQQASRAKDVWVLGASTGGPLAVKEFIKHVPAGLDIAFLYVQHIDSGQAESLVKMMTAAGHYPAHIARQGLVLAKNTLTVVTADRSIHIHTNGTLSVNKSPWNGFYAPSIDQVGANVARVYGRHSGIIIFSGMGDDGAASCRLVKQQGGKVWAQTPGDCTITSMPDAAIATRSVTMVATPMELAKALANGYRGPAKRLSIQGRASRMDSRN